ncbi:MAG: hypothetical protein CMJ78_03210 [Planctomycetaceae bacterium]|nr:hypothetical protein [Planctomycetaceae bacterium]
MSGLKSALASVGGGVYRKLSDKYASIQLRSKSTEDVFTDIFKENFWQGKDSVSGTGSDLDQIGLISERLPVLFKALDVRSVLDLPCGDFLWMKDVDLSDVEYVGADIVKELIADNVVNFAREGVRFEHLNLLDGPLPATNLILVRDCLVHFSYADIDRALNTICNSDIEYLLVTSYTGERENKDILTGQWRAINLERAPFNLPKPLQAINEGCTEGDGAFADKALALWRVEDIRQARAAR